MLTYKQDFVYTFCVYRTHCRRSKFHISRQLINCKYCITNVFILMNCASCKSHREADNSIRMRCKNRSTKSSDYVISPYIQMQTITCLTSRALPLLLTGHEVCILSFSKNVSYTLFLNPRRIQTVS